MKIILYANISANGKVLLSENPNHLLPGEVFTTNLQDIIKAGNLVMGRKSFDNFEKAVGSLEKIREILPDVALISLSKNPSAKEGIKSAKSPEAVVEYLKNKGFAEIIIGGGTETYKSFLEADLISDVVFNIIPIITQGGDLGNIDGLNLRFRLIDHRLIGNDFIQLHYTNVKTRL